MSTPHSIARRPRRPGGIKHDPDAINESEILDDARLEAAHRRTTTPQVEPLVLVSEAVLLLTARASCQGCPTKTPVFALAALPEFPTEHSEARLLRRIRALPSTLDKAVRELSKGAMRPARSLRSAAGVWLAHCSACGASQMEPKVLGAGGPFQPWTYAQRKAIKEERIQGPFALEYTRSIRSEPLLNWLAWKRKLADRGAAGFA